MEPTRGTDLVYAPISASPHLDHEVLSLVRPGLTVYAGPMYSSKSAALITAIDEISQRFREIIKVRFDDPDDFDIEDYVVAFSPANNSRDNERGHAIRTRGRLKNSISYPAVGLDPTEPWRMLEASFHHYPFVMIDEGSFWGHYAPDGAFLGSAGLKETVQLLVEQGREVYVAGLSADFRNEPFGDMAPLLAIADHRPEMRAITPQVRDGKATRTQRILGGHPAKDGDPILVVGDIEDYEAVAPEEHKVPGKHERLIADLRRYVD